MDHFSKPNVIMKSHRNETKINL